MTTREEATPRGQGAAIDRDSRLDFVPLLSCLFTLLWGLVSSLTHLLAAGRRRLAAN